MEFAGKKRKLLEDDSAAKRRKKSKRESFLTSKRRNSNPFQKADFPGKMREKWAFLARWRDVGEKSRREQNGLIFLITTGIYRITLTKFYAKIEECSGEVEETYRRLNAPIEERVEARLMWEGIRNYLPKLTPKECEVMIALYIDRLSVSEVAAKLGVETNTISTHRHNACEKIRKEMEGK